MSTPNDLLNPNLDAEPFSQERSGARPSGCLVAFGWTAVIFWVVLVIVVSQGAAWIWQQLTFGAPPQRFDPRWLSGLAGGLFLWIPLLILEKAGQGRFQALARPLRLAAELVLLMVPARLLRVTDSQAVALWQIAALLLFLGRLAWLTRQKSAALEPSPHVPGEHSVPQEHRSRLRPAPVALALACGGLTLLPWVAIGALGSPLDTLLALAAAFLTGLAAAVIILTSESGQNPGPSSLRVGMTGVWIRATLVMGILAMALGANCNEWLLLLCFPAVGWLCQAFKGWLLAEPPGLKRLLAPALAAGLAASGPLVWIDPDELSLLIASGTGDLIEWATQAGWAMAGCALAGVLAISLLRRAWDSSRGGPRAAWLLAGLMGLVLIGLYLFTGQPGWHGERIFVILKDQADVSAAKAIQDVARRRSMVYQELTRQAEASQAGLRQALDRFGIRYTPYFLVNGLEVEAGPLVRAWLLARPEVDRVLDSPRLRPLPAALPSTSGGERAPASPPWNLTMLRANRVWDELNVTGKGIIIGQSDSGVDGTHPELAGQYLGRNGQNAAAWLDPWFGSREPVDFGGHGTHTLGSILGKSAGVAPDAQWIGCVNLGRNLGNPALYLNCMQFMLAPFPSDGDPWKDGRPAQGAQVMNNSWGCPAVEGCDAAVFLPAFRALTAAGIFVVVSAGNDGDYGCASLNSPPAIYAEVFSVGAVDSSGNRASFSSLGPVTADGSGRPKPDLMAPGEDVLSAFPGGSYAIQSGTSMAGPHVAGVVALMWSANPRLVGDIDQTRRILLETARPYSGTISNCGLENTAGRGIVDAYQAVLAAQKIK